MVPNFDLKYVLGIVVLALMLSSIPIAAQKTLPDPGATPDSWTYGFKRFFESADMFFTFDDLAKAKKHAKYAELRLSEARAMADKGKPEFVDDLMRDYEGNINKSNQIAEKAQQQGRDTTKVTEIVALATSNHLDVLNEIYEKVPEQAKPAIKKARSVSMKGYKNALIALSKQKPERAAKINLDTIKDRLEKAKQKAEAGESEDVEGTLKEYEEMVEISGEIAEEDEDAAEEIGSNFNKQLEELDEIEDKVPGKIREKVREKKFISSNKQRGVLRELAKTKPERATNISLEAAKKRLEKARAKVERNETEDTEKEIEEFKEFTNLGTEISQIAQGLGKNTTTVDQLVAKATTHHLDVLNEIYEKVPEQAKPAIEKAMNDSMKGYKNALVALSKQKPERAAKIHSEITKEKLEKVKEKAREGKEEVKRILEEYEELDEIPEKMEKEYGKNLTALAEHICEMKYKHIAVLENISEEVSEPSKPIIERVINTSLGRHVDCVERMLRLINKTEEEHKWKSCSKDEDCEDIGIYCPEKLNFELTCHIPPNKTKGTCHCWPKWRKVQHNCSTNADCRDLVCPMLIGHDTQICEEGICKCGARWQIRNKTEWRERFKEEWTNETDSMLERMKEWYTKKDIEKQIEKIEEPEEEIEEEVEEEIEEEVEPTNESTGQGVLNK